MNWLSFGNKNSKGRSSPEPPVQPNIYSHPELKSDTKSDYAMAHCQQMVTDQSVFPTKYEQKFSDEFSRTISKMLRLIWHVISHIYHSHYQAFCDLGLVGHLSMTTLHFVLFAEKFHLLDEKEFLPLEDLIGPLKKYAIPSPNNEESDEAVSDQ
ncbi:Oidioi.mRNA.OKI2018_I69.XSR.g16093.t2.cds [Oikopleura dioica]|uniref:Oidioi.mRNA.OKI2018_I69.XSR.g16093.t2.cds n=1 Tax=Oikopleura dioica TaxID=34765 RepID=A0ABN7SFI1_OIKDI|nr:Oidioi.mRNA.OKI2018_I69.XSR.g16093.t2.cds [Oikopleura dioica]